MIILGSIDIFFKGSGNTGNSFQMNVDILQSPICKARFTINDRRVYRILHRIIITHTQSDFNIIIPIAVSRLFIRYFIVYRYSLALGSRIQHRFIIC